MEFEDIMHVLAEFSNLGAEFLVDEIVSCSREIDLLREDIESRDEVLETLLDELNEQKTAFDNSMLRLETLDVELIRSKTEYKRLTNNIKKLKSLNVSTTTLELTKNDRRKLAMKRLRLSLMKQLLQTPLVEDDKLLIVNSHPFKMKTLTLKDSKKKTENCEAIWKNIGSCSGFNRQWRTLFQ